MHDIFTHVMVESRRGVRTGQYVLLSTSDMKAWGRRKLDYGRVCLSEICKFVPIAAVEFEVGTS